MYRKYNFIQYVLIVVSTFFSCNAYAQKVDAEDQITGLLSKMTLEEKVGMLHANSSFTSAGVPRLGIPELVMSDGPHGVRLEHGRDWDTSNDHVNDSGTYLPTGITLASTWNTDLGYASGSVLGSEANDRGKDVILGPGINIIRTPLNGRNFEYMSEDPYLISKMVVGFINGVQDQGISACVKHFAANNQEKDRSSIDVEMSERALREIYLPGFKAAVMEGDVNTIMGSYNKLRGQYATHNYYLIKQILKTEWGFKGIVMSDWGAVHNTTEALYNGTDLEMGSDMSAKPDYSKYHLGDTVIQLVKNGKVQESVIDEKVRRILRVMIKTGMLDKSRKAGQFATPEHQKTALKIAEEGIVLLKNEQNILPLISSNIKSLAVIGVNAQRDNAMGGGSAQVRATYEITPLEGLKNISGKNINVKYAPGYRLEKDAKADKQLIDEAVKLAVKSDKVVFVGGWIHGYDYKKWNEGAYDAEAFDKPDMNLPFGQDELINAILKAKPDAVIVLIGGGPVDMTSWIGNTKALIEAWYPGMEGGNALANIIFGKVNPSGKLPISFPKKLEDAPAHKLGDYPGFKGVQHYNEDIFVGYRYFDTYKVEPQFAFGHGLSYTTFNFSDAKIFRDGNSFTVSVNIKNNGKQLGGEVVQFYIKQENAPVIKPDKELKAFKKVFLKPGESQQIEVKLGEDAFQYYDEEKLKWVALKGKYQVLIGNSSRNILQQVSIDF